MIPILLVDLFCLTGFGEVSIHEQVAMLAIPMGQKTAGGLWELWKASSKKVKASVLK